MQVGNTMNTKLMSESVSFMIFIWVGEMMNTKLILDISVSLVKIIV